MVPDNCSNRFIKFISFATLAVFLYNFARPSRANETAIIDISIQAINILNDKCAACHGILRVSGSLDVRDPKTMLGKNNPPYVTPGSTDNSYIWKRIINGDMPPDNELTNNEKAVLKEWIKQGAKISIEKRITEQRPKVKTIQVLSTIRSHLRNADPEDRPFLKYFTLYHLHNDDTIDSARLGRHRAALSKAINSLHWKSTVVLPRPVDQNATVLYIDIRDLGWDKKGSERNDRWTEMMKRYPYGLANKDPNDPEVEKTDLDIIHLGNGLPVMMRGDWFVARATRPPLYELILRLPKTAKELEGIIGVDSQENIVAGRAARAGFSRSFVSSQNRVVERHVALFGAYWKSYDFRKGSEKSNVFRFPLGPQMSESKHANFQDFAFIHDGGEMIFHLPNGLQGYYLSDGNGNYLDKGPVDVVADPGQRSGTAEIVNGLSCISCHSRGLIDSINDDVRKGAVVSGELLRRVHKLYPPRESLQQLLKDDNRRFSAALEKAIGSFLVDADRQNPLVNISEPVTELLMKQYNPDIVLATAAMELGISAQELGSAIASMESLKDLGLRTLSAGGSIKRDLWDNGDRLFNKESDGQSLFHKIARELGLGNRRMVGR